jgi:hypothetical protein
MIWMPVCRCVYEIVEERGVVILWHLFVKGRE